MASGSVTISSDRIAQRFADLRKEGRCAFVPYVTAGHPDVARSVALLQGLESAGAGWTVAPISKTLFEMTADERDRTGY